MDFKNWITQIASEDWMVYIKRLSANDTGATKSHQAGIYFPKSVLSSIFPSIGRKDVSNPEAFFKASIESDSVPEQVLRAIYYNQKSRNEKRITRWNQGTKYTPLQDPEKTGSIAIFAFNNCGSGDSEYMKAWVCRDINEENYLEERIGEIDPQSTYFERGDIIFEGAILESPIKSDKYPREWNEEFPSGAAIINHLFEQGLHADLTADERILKRRSHEFDLFKLIEHHHTIPLIKQGFDDVESFIKLANSISNRRKSRSGKSLELHLENIFKEEGLTLFGVQCRTEENKKPDFLFPGCDEYHDPNFPTEKLRVLAVKTTVKDRWRQILNEARKIETSYLFTLQQGVSENQFREMTSEKVKLVVPSPIHKSFPSSIREHLYTLTRFIEETKAI
ncbi:restriction endonuclease [Spongiibacter sp. KMU-166]|uniref:Restriction endonuclease n=1 Tax=Spongiibacter thalassae TaxID=2721624 RepID=A0ABX1GJA3_9GAMM|nr:type II restriction endonuclease [Spongiibacter thalassae]NKI18532.1 restriction endonuclease [Spongiibacter thalassae]